MLYQIFIRSFPYFFIFFFIFFENVPIYFFDEKVIKPFISFSILYCWICQDYSRFRPFWLLIFGVFCDLLQSEIVGLTSLFFLLIFHIQRKSDDVLLSPDFKESWIKFGIILTIYIFIYYLLNYIFSSISFSTVNVFICLVLTFLFFPIFFLIIDKLSNKFRKFDE